MQYQITTPLLLDIDIQYFEYQKDTPILRNIKQQIHNVVRPGVQQGQIVALLGPSGIGKSTIFELLAGLKTPQQGSIKVFDKEKKDLVPVEVGLVGMVYQSYELYPFLSVRAQLELGAKKGKLNNPAEKVEFYLNHFNLKEHSNKYPNELSGGQRQRLAIAQQLLCSNTILLMDEPFSGLDPLVKSNICDLIADISLLDEYQTIIIVSHDIEPTLSVSDTVWLVGKTPEGGATIVETIDMMQHGLCWQKNIEELPAFQQMVNYVTKRFWQLG